MSATTRTIQATPDLGRLFAIIASAVVAGALLLALAYGLLAANGTVMPAPAAGARPVATYDHDANASRSWGPAVTSAGGHSRFGQ